ANHRETLGDLPSPWTVSTMIAAAKDLSFVAWIEPAIGRWGETYAVEAAGRSWVNLGFFYRWMDHAGVPRALAADNIGGDAAGPADRAFLWRRFLRALPNWPRQVWQGVMKVRAAPAALRVLDGRIEAATGLPELFRVTVEVWTLGIHTALSIAALFAIVAKVRSILRLPSSAELVTHALMDEYDRLTTLPDPAARTTGLDDWLSRYGHRGPFESDFARPRFAELRDVLLRDLTAAPVRSPRPPAPRARRWLGVLARPVYRIDEWREWFRDECMRRWGRIRERLLADGGRLVAAGDLDRA